MEEVDTVSFRFTGVFVCFIPLYSSIFLVLFITSSRTHPSPATSLSPIGPYVSPWIPFPFPDDTTFTPVVPSRSFNPQSIVKLSDLRTSILLSSAPPLPKYHNVLNFRFISSWVNRYPPSGVLGVTYGLCVVHGLNSRQSCVTTTSTKGGCLNYEKGNIDW